MRLDFSAILYPALSSNILDFAFKANRVFQDVFYKTNFIVMIAM